MRAVLPALPALPAGAASYIPAPCTLFLLPPRIGRGEGRRGEPLAM